MNQLDEDDELYLCYAWGAYISSGRATDGSILLQTGDTLLMETGDKLLLE